MIETARDASRARRRSETGVGPRPASARASDLRIRAVGRFDALAAPGGGEIQLAATTAALADLGYDARAWRPWDDDLGAGDVVHFFGSRPEFAPLIAAAQAAGARVAVSTIAWFDRRNAWRESTSLVRRVSAACRYAVRAACPSVPSWRRRQYHAADLLLPNSQAEAEQLMRLFEVPARKIRVVPNGADPRFAGAEPTLFRRRFGDRPFVLAVGRIEPRKNQLNLVRAMRGSALRLVVVGDVVPGHEAYAQQCRRFADGDALFLPGLAHDDPLLASAYAACACAALVGWYETPGLAALEAAMTGAPIVVPAGGCAYEYFGPAAEYVVRGDPDEILAAVDRAVARGRDVLTAQMICDQFTWRRTAEITAEAYATLR